ncbi:MAG: glycosyltransferase [bacterium]|nr:glycosyltransferase [bacterium]
MTKISSHLFLKSKPNKNLLIVTSIASFVYLGAITFLLTPGNYFLFTLLIIGEIFHTWQAITYIYTVWDLEYKAPFNNDYLARVDVFITVAGEPVELVRETALNAKAMDYPYFNVYILNDGYVANKDNWKEIEKMASEIGVGCFTREIGGGAKAGNINNAALQTNAPYIAIFDADHIPKKDFLKKTMGYFSDEKMGFVQTPQFYKNSNLNRTTSGAWEQQELFYGPICRGKNRLNSATMCGTNMILSRTALLEVGGMCTESIAEDFATGLFMHEKGWKSTYVSEVLAEGLAPEDFLSYSKQQFRWARGALDVIFKYKLITRGGLTFAQKIQYLSSVSFFLSGIIVLMNVLLPIVYLFTGQTPILISGMLLALIFLPYIFLTIYNLSLTSNFLFTFNALSFAMSGFWIHIKALLAAISGEKSGFSVTSKTALEGNFPELIRPHLIYMGLVVLGIPFAIYREGFSPSFVNNLAWALVNIAIFIPFMRAAMPGFSFMEKLGLSKIFDKTDKKPLTNLKGRVSGFVEFFKFVIAGAFNTAIDFTVLNLFISTIGLGANNFNYVVFKAISFIAAVTSSYFLNKFWVFKNHGGNTLKSKELINFLAISIIGFFLNIFVSSLVFNIGPNISSFSSSVWANIGALLGTLTVLMWNFFGYKLFVFKKTSSIISQY